MEYSYIVKHTLAVPALAKAIQDLETDSGALNLITPDWENKLNENEAYKLHKENGVLFSKGHTSSNEKTFTRNIIKPCMMHKVILVGCFTYDKTKESEGHTSFVARDCYPLQVIGDAMRENPTQKLHDGARLFMDYCDPALCHTCYEAHLSRNVPLDFERNWCVTKLRVFNGKDLKHAFKKPLEASLTKMGSFLAICQITIRSRTTFGDDKYKIGGTIQNMIVFQESAIKPCPNMVFLDPITPAIEFPSEDAHMEEEIQNIT